MREDMFKVIVERPRRGGHGQRRGRVRALEDLPTKIGMRRFHRERGDFKGLNENLAPLCRYLERQVGRPWNKVHSEICEHLSIRNVVQQHVRQHLRNFVGLHPEEHGYRYARFYVDAKDGLLKHRNQRPDVKAERRREAEKKRHQPEVTRIVLSPDRALQRIDGTWYELELAPLPEAEFRVVTETRTVGSHHKPFDVEVAVRRLASRPVFDAASGKAIPVGPRIDSVASWRDFDRNHPDRRYARARRQLSTAELRRHDLTNLTRD